MAKRPGLGMIEMLIIFGVMVVIGGLIYVALVNKKATPVSQQTSVTKTDADANREVKTIDDVKAEVTAVEKDDTGDLVKDLDGLTSDLNGL